MAWTALLRDIPDFPKPGILFKDITPVLADGDAFAEAIAAMPIPKPMRWGAHTYAFARPVHWLVMLLGDEVIDCTILAQKSGRDSRGHRFHHPENVRITAPANYLEDLRKAYVLADFADTVVPILQERGVFRTEYTGTTLRDHLGLTRPTPGSRRPARFGRVAS